MKETSSENESIRELMVSIFTSHRREDHVYVYFLYSLNDKLIKDKKIRSVILETIIKRMGEVISIL